MVEGGTIIEMDEATELGIRLNNFLTEVKK